MTNVVKFGAVIAAAVEVPNPQKNCGVSSAPQEKTAHKRTSAQSNSASFERLISHRLAYVLDVSGAPGFDLIDRALGGLQTVRDGTFDLIAGSRTDIAHQPAYVLLEIIEIFVQGVQTGAHILSRMPVSTVFLAKGDHNDTSDVLDS